LLIMSLWIEALKSAGRGHSDRARDLLNEIIIALRYPKQGRTAADCAYDGPVAKAVLHAVNGFTDTEDRQLALNNAEELIDYIVDQIGRKIQRTIELAEYCLTHSDKGLDSVTKDFEGLGALKRSPEALQAYVALRLQSMVSVGVEFAMQSVAVNQACALQTDETRLLGFDERQLLKSLQINEKWLDFRERQELTYKHESYDLLSDNVSSEASDFGAIAYKFANFSFEHDLEFDQLTKQISELLNQTLNEFQSEKPTLGFGPIAWHRVWWSYDQDGYLNLTCLAPECSTDEILAAHISGEYPEVQNMNRLIAQRRRTRLEYVCQERVTELYQLNGRAR